MTFFVDLCLYFQFFSDCRGVDADMDDLQARVANDDLGHDVESAKELLKKHEVCALISLVIMLLYVICYLISLVILSLAFKLFFHFAI